LLEFCYTKKYTVEVNSKHACLEHAQLYTLGDKYSITGLSTFTEKHLRNAFTAAIPIAKVDISPKHTANNLLRLKDMLVAISHIYENTRENDRIRKMLASLPWQSGVLRKFSVEWTSFLRRVPEYACDMSLYSVNKIEEYADVTERHHEYNCPLCSFSWSMTHIIEGGTKFRCLGCREDLDGAIWQFDDDAGKPNTREYDMENPHLLL
jgi:hypothetical protein